MGIFCGTIEYQTIIAGCCNAPFALSQDHYNQRRKDHKEFFCPVCGGRQSYIGETEDQRKLREANDLLQKAQANVQHERNKTAVAEAKAARVTRQYRKVRDRVKNGVCPCCNRTFGNLANHMRTQHPDFGADKELKTMREAYGLTQSGLATEIGVSVADIGNYEHGRRVPNQWRLDRIIDWLAQQAA